MRQSLLFIYEEKEEKKEKEQNKKKTQPKHFDTMWTRQITSIPKRCHLVTSIRADPNVNHILHSGSNERTPSETSGQQNGQQRIKKKHKHQNNRNTEFPTNWKI